MIGTRLVEDGSKAVWQITAVNGGLYVIARLDAFEPPREIPAAELAERFKVEAAEPAPVDEQAGWRALADAFEEGNFRARRGEVDPGELPEAVFARASAEATNAKPKRRGR
jgi:hypothetical protein